MYKEQEEVITSTECYDVEIKENELDVDLDSQGRSISPEYFDLHERDFSDVSPLGRSTPIGSCSDSGMIESTETGTTSRNPLFTDGWATMLYGPGCVRHRRAEPRKQWLEYCGIRERPPTMMARIMGVEYPLIEKQDIPYYRNQLFACELPEDVTKTLGQVFKKSLGKRQPHDDVDLPPKSISDSQWVEPKLISPLNNEVFYLPYPSADYPIIDDDVAVYDDTTIDDSNNVYSPSFNPSSTSALNTTVLAADGSFNPNFTCDFCYAKVTRESQKFGHCPPLRSSRGMWYGHRLRDANGNVTCPRLFNMQCHGCGATGPKAHTVSHCPIFNNRNSTIQSSNQVPVVSY